MSQREQLIDELNTDLDLEFRSIVQYVLHVATIKGARYQQTLQELSHHLRQEVDHALVVAKQIDFLGATPTVFDATPSDDAEAALRNDLALEEQQLDRYRTRVEQANEAGLPDVAEALAPLLQQTQDHIRDLRSALGE